MINLNQLRAFYEVAKSLNFSVAAENLFVTQPAVTKQIKLFQEFCNLRLFNRHRGKLYLTDEGKKVFVYTSRIFELERQLEETISALQNLKQGSLRIGTTKTYAKNFMPFLLSSFRKMFPEIIFELDEGSSLSMAESLLDFRNSLAIVAKVEDKPEISFTPLLLEPIVLIASSQHPLALKSKLDFQDLSKEPFVMKELGSGTRKLVEQYARNEKTKLNVIAQTSNMDVIKKLVIQEQAIAFVVQSSVKDELSRGDLISLPVYPSSHLTVYIAYMRDYELPFPARAFLDYLLSLADSNDLPVGTDPIIQKLGKLKNIERTNMPSEYRLLRNKRILIVDDEPDVLETLEDLLPMCQIQKAGNYTEAKKLLEEAYFDMAILDIMGVDGYKLLKLAQEKNVIGVMLTAHALDIQNIKRSYREGAASYLPKEEMQNISTYLNDILEAKEQGKHLWWRWFDRLGAYFSSKFGPNWEQEDKEFLDKLKYHDPTL